VEWQRGGRGRGTSTSVLVLEGKGQGEVEGKIGQQGKAGKGMRAGIRIIIFMIIYYDMRTDYGVLLLLLVY
jgi:hypothetical protein